MALSALTNAGLAIGPVGDVALGRAAWPAPAAVLALSSYLMLRRRLPTRADDIAADAALILVALGFVIWVWAPADGTPASVRAAALGTVLLDMLALWLLARLVSFTVHHPAAYRYLLGGLFCLFVVDAVIAGGALSGNGIPVDRLIGLRLWGYCLFAAATLHPSLPERFEPVPPRTGRPSRGQLVAAGAVAVVGPVALALRTFSGAEVSSAELVASAALPLLVTLNLIRQVCARAGAEYRAQHDGLSGLPNRTLFIDRLEMAILHARRSGDRIGVLFLDLDRFKNVNDSLGHDAGNVLLQGVAGRLRRTVREEDTVARFGGDEFTVLLPGLSHGSECAEVAAKLLDAFDEPFSVGGRQLVVTTSIGVAVYPDDGLDVEALLKHADTAMYRAKGSGRATFQCYTADMSARAKVRHSLESNLHAAVERGELVLHYQPKVGLDDLGIVGVEALARWRHPRLGFVPPDAFIPVAEESGLIMTLGEWAVEEACRQGESWRMDGLATPVAVNLSARQLTQQDTKALVNRILVDTGYVGELLELELTESIFLRNTTTVGSSLRDLYALGVRCSIDDFGTGFSGLKYLAQMPIDALKIDRSYVAGIGNGGKDDAIVEAVIALAHSLDMRVIAEGVETLAQALFLRERGCEEVQGFLISPPLSAPEMTDLLRCETVPGGAVRTLAARSLQPSAAVDPTALGELDPDLVRQLLLTCTDGDEAPIDLDLVATVLLALQLGEPRSAKRTWSKSAPARLAVGTFAGLIPLSGGLAAAGTLPEPAQVLAGTVLRELGVSVPAPATAAAAELSASTASPATESPGDGSGRPSRTVSSPDVAYQEYLDAALTALPGARDRGPASAVAQAGGAPATIDAAPEPSPVTVAPEPEPEDQASPTPSATPPRRTPAPAPTVVAPPVTAAPAPTVVATPPAPPDVEPGPPAEQGPPANAGPKKEPGPPADQGPPPNAGPKKEPGPPADQGRSPNAGPKKEPGPPAHAGLTSSGSRKGEARPPASTGQRPSAGPKRAPGPPDQGVSATSGAQPGPRADPGLPPGAGPKKEPGPPDHAGPTTSGTG